MSIKRFKSLIRRLLPKHQAPHRIFAGPLRGMRIVTSWYDYPAAILGYTERTLLDWFAENVNEGETWLDIGAHYGYTALALSRLVGSSGRVIAFEPMIMTAGCIQKTARLNRLPQLVVVPMALGNPDDIGFQEMSTIRGMVDGTIEVDSEVIYFYLARPSWIWPRICNQSDVINGVKIDVQGMEVEVLEGMLSLLQAHRPKLVVEFHKGVNREGLLELIELGGYAPDSANPIDYIQGESTLQFLDNRSYYFNPEL